MRKSPLFRCGERSPGAEFSRARLRTVPPTISRAVSSLTFRIRKFFVSMPTPDAQNRLILSFTKRSWCAHACSTPPYTVYFFRKYLNMIKVRAIFGFHRWQIWKSIGSLLSHWSRRDGKNILWRVCYYF